MYGAEAFKKPKQWSTLRDRILLNMDCLTTAHTGLTSVSSPCSHGRSTGQPRSPASSPHVCSRCAMIDHTVDPPRALLCYTEIFTQGLQCTCDPPPPPPANPTPSIIRNRLNVQRGALDHELCSLTRLKKRAFWKLIIQDLKG